MTRLNVWGSAVANRTVPLRVDILFRSNFFGKGFLVPICWGFPVQLGDKFLGAQVLVGVLMALDAPRHRQLFVLVDDFHLIDAAVARNAAHTAIHVGGVVEIHKFGQVVDSFPLHALARFPALVDRL